MYMYMYIYISTYTCFVLPRTHQCCSTFNDPKCSVGRAYIQTIKDEKITLCEYTTQSFMFYTFVRYTFHLKKQRNIKY